MLRHASALATLTLVYVLSGCGEGGTVTGPEGLSSLERSAMEEIALERVTDLFWVGDGTHGGSFPSLAAAYSLPATPAGYLASAIVDPAFDAGVFEPTCGPSVVEDVRQCLRLVKHEDGDWELQVYFTVPPDRTPRARPELTYRGEPPVSSVRYRPQPLRIWNVRMTGESEPVSVSTELEESYALTSEKGVDVSIAVEGTLQVDLTEPRLAEAIFRVSGLDGCDRLQVEFRGVADGETGGDVRCGDRVWAEFAFTPGQPLELVWRE